MTTSQQLLRVMTTTLQGAGSQENGVLLLSQQSIAGTIGFLARGKSLSHWHHILPRTFCSISKEKTTAEKPKL